MKETTEGLPETGPSARKLGVRLYSVRNYDVLASKPDDMVHSEELGHNLRFRQNNPSHGLIEPKKPMTLQKFQEALAETRSKWKLHCR